MEIGEEERYAAGALFTLALHLTQVEEALVLHFTTLSVCRGSSMTYSVQERAASFAEGICWCKCVYGPLQVEYGAGGDGTLDAAWGCAPLIGLLMLDCQADPALDGKELSRVSIFQISKAKAITITQVS